MTRRTYNATIVRDGSTCFIPVPFDPKPVFGKVRAPVRVTLNGYAYRSTIAAMGGTFCLPLRKSHREAARLAGGETLDVTLELDTDERFIDPPADLAAALRLPPSVWARWERLNYSHRREHVEAVESAKKSATRTRRVERIRKGLAEPSKIAEAMSHMRAGATNAR